MSQEDTYITAIDPSEAAMTPAMEETPDAPPPAAQVDLTQDDPAMRPAQRHNASYALERLRNRVRTPDRAQWISASLLPIDGASTRPPEVVGQAANDSPARQTISHGAALNTLMRSAARQYTPAPMLSQPQSGMPGAQQATAGQPQMRGALRQVVRNAQLTQGMQGGPARQPSPIIE